jgi:hypothetical protein
MNALSNWDIIDLSNLPEVDVHLATQKLLLRQLYMPFRIEIGSKNLDETIPQVFLSRINASKLGLYPYVLLISQGIS